MPHRRRAGYPRSASLATRFNERTQDRQRQHFVTCVCSVVELRGQIRVPGKRAEPFAILVDEATKLPGRKRGFDQGKRQVGPRAGLDQLIDECRLTSPFQNRTNSHDDIDDEIASWRWRKPKLVRQPIETVLVFRIQQHDTISRGITALCDRITKMVPKVIKKPEGTKCREIWMS
jgi:hypothetical protein